MTKNKLITEWKLNINIVSLISRNTHAKNQSDWRNAKYSIPVKSSSLLNGNTMLSISLLASNISAIIYYNQWANERSLLCMVIEHLATLAVSSVSTSVSRSESEAITSVLQASLAVSSTSSSWQHTCSTLKADPCDTTNKQSYNILLR